MQNSFEFDRVSFELEILKIIIKLFKSPLASWAQSCARPSQPLPFGLALASCHPRPSSHPTHLAHLRFSPSPPSAGAAVALCVAPRHAAPAQPTPTPCPCLAHLCSLPSRSHLGLLPMHWTIEDQREPNSGELSPSEPIRKNPNQT
jgi:hypothetical protein